MTDSGRPPRSATLDKLRAEVLRQGGEWTGARAASFVGDLWGEAPTSGRGAEFLKRLEGEGLLKRDGRKWRWTVVPGATATPALSADAARLREDVFTNARRIERLAAGLATANKGDPAATLGTGARWIQTVANELAAQAAALEALEHAESKEKP